MPFPHELPPCGVRVKLGVALCLQLKGSVRQALLGGRKEVCDLAREDEYVGGTPTRDR